MLYSFVIVKIIPADDDIAGMSLGDFTDLILECISTQRKVGVMGVYQMRMLLFQVQLDHHISGLLWCRMV